MEKIFEENTVFSEKVARFACVVGDGTPSRGGPSSRIVVAETPGIRKQTLFLFPKINHIGFGTHGHVQISKNHENEGFPASPIMKSKSY